MGYVFYQKRFRKRVGAKQRAQCTGRNSAETSDDRTIEMMDKKQEENVCGTKEGLHHVYTGRRAATATAKVYVHRSSNIGLLCFTEQSLRYVTYVWGGAIKIGACLFW